MDDGPAANSIVYSLTRKSTGAPAVAAAPSAAAAAAGSRPRCRRCRCCCWNPEIKFIALDRAFPSRPAITTKRQKTESQPRARDRPGSQDIDCDIEALINLISGSRFVTSEHRMIRCRVHIDVISGYVVTISVYPGVGTDIGYVPISGILDIR